MYKEKLVIKFTITMYRKKKGTSNKKLYFSSEWKQRAFSENYCYMTMLNGE